MEINNEWAEMLKRARTELPKRLGYDEIWSQSQMAAILGVTPNHLAKLERAETEPSATIQFALDYAMQMASHGLDARAKSVW